MDQALIDYLARWGHFLFGIAWIGLLYYFNFVQTEYFKEADPDARTDAFSKLVPRALGRHANCVLSPLRDPGSALRKSKRCRLARFAAPRP